MRGLLTRGFFICAIFISIWILMVTYWRATSRMPTSSEVMLYLLALPLGFLLGIWLIRKVATVVAANATARAESTIAAQAANDTESDSKASDAQHERGWTLAILASALRSPHGASADELAGALISKEARLELDAELTDTDGFPVPTGRIADVDPGTTRDQITAGLESENIHVPAWTDEQLRALSMAADVLTELANQTLSHPQLVDYINADDSKRDAIALPMLQLLPVFPGRWPDDVRKTAANWFKHQIAQQGWPLEKILLSPLFANSLSGPFCLIDNMSLHAHRQALPCFCLLIACESFIGEASVAEWEDTGRLLNGKSNTGQTPGEGAVGFLIGDQHQAMLMNVELPTAIHRVAQGRREKSADASGRISSELLSELSKDALATADTAAEQIAMLIADSDHRGSRMDELMSLGYSVLPDLDLGGQCFKVAADCGAAGAVTSLTALALAHHAAGAQSSAILCVSNQDAFDRSAVVVRPLISAATQHSQTQEPSNISPTQ